MIEIEFPRDIAYQAQGGPSWFTTVNEGFSGFEQTNQNWALPKGKWKIALDHKAFSYFQQVYQFWMKAAGRAKVFRFLDLKDYQVTNEPCALIIDSPYTGCIYQLQNSYAGALSPPKPILKPITAAVERFDGTYCSDTVSIFVNGVQQNSGWTLDYTTGLVTFTNAPNDTVTWSGQFHYPVRFDMDDCQAIVEESDTADGNALITWPDVILIEHRINPST
jgi:uncharacterized protein (TIGR02217 family)